MMPEYTCNVDLLITADDEDGAYDQLVDSGFTSGALIGTVLIKSLDIIEEY